MDEDSDSPTGSGLGLSIIQWIAQAHGGEVHVESTPGNGSSFEVRFEAL
jgi:signal transduction histidine kinase